LTRQNACHVFSSTSDRSISTGPDCSTEKEGNAIEKLLALAGTPRQGSRRQHTAFRGRATVSKPYLQGWAVVENPSDEDWREVKMALVSGRPIPFRMGQYHPWTRRGRWSPP
jgi:hypothetical protein